MRKRLPSAVIIVGLILIFASAYIGGRYDATTTSSTPTTVNVQRLTDNALRACEHAHMTACHTERDSDGSLGVYGTPPTTAAPPPNMFTGYIGIPVYCPHAVHAPAETYQLYEPGRKIPYIGETTYRTATGPCYHIAGPAYIILADGSQAPCKDICLGS